MRSKERFNVLLLSLPCEGFKQATQNLFILRLSYKNGGECILQFTLDVSRYVYTHIYSPGKYIWGLRQSGV